MSGEITTSTVQANGLTFQVDSCGSGGKFAICLHGYPESSFSWRFQLPLLAGLGYTAWAPNLRGYAGSSRPPHKSDYRIDCLTADVAGLIDAAGARSSLLIGHDWGGVIAWIFALQKIRPLDGLIVMNFPHPKIYRERMARWPQITRSWYVFLFQLPWFPEFMMGSRGARTIRQTFYATAVDKSRFPEEVLDVYRKNALIPGALTAMINYYRANWGIHKGGLFAEQRQAIESVLETPTLMIWGEKDIALGKHLTYGTEKLVNNLTLRYLPDVSHWVQQEAPETVNAMIEAWLGGREVPYAGRGGKLVPAPMRRNG
ncbi:MAG: alpha/beta hydrolase [Dehalococcoidia bacterium]|nr:alpha/beta hydrolase [Dehalococcoidia bacterium]